MPSLRIVGAGRAGTSFAHALSGAGWTVRGLLGRHDDPSSAAAGVDLCIIATPDSVVAATAARIVPAKGGVVAHVSGSLGLASLAPHGARAAVHPLVSLADPERGARALSSGAWFAVTADRAAVPLAGRLVGDLGGRSLEVADDDRAAYHAAACIASNHVVALLAQVERIAGSAGLPLDAYLDLVRGTVDNVAALGPRDALTGPASRGDWATIAGHLRAIGPEEAVLYSALAEAAASLADQTLPPIEALA